MTPRELQANRSGTKRGTMIVIVRVRESSNLRYLREQLHLLFTPWTPARYEPKSELIRLCDEDQEVVHAICFHKIG